MSQLVYSPCSLGVKANKKSILTADEHGYRTVILGALNTFNSQGHYYTLDKSKDVFESDSNAFFMTLLRKGQLFSEYGHPNMEPGQAMEDYLARLSIVRENRICSHIKKVWLDDDYSRYTSSPLEPGTVVVLGEVAPYGNLKQVAEDGFSNPNINTAYSVRGITENKVLNGILNRAFTDINTWDYVFSPGIGIASDWNLPNDVSNESVITKKSISDQTLIITPDLINRAKESVGQMHLSGAMESDSIRFLDALEKNYSVSGSIEQARKSTLFNW